MIIETCLVSSFIPSMNMAVYCATKAFVLEFGRILRGKLKSRGINVCVLCPGNMDSEMGKMAEKERQNSVLNSIPFLDMRRVAANTLKVARNGRAVYTPGAFYKCIRVIGKVVPHNIIPFAKG